MSLFKGCPLRGVSLYVAIAPHCVHPCSDSLVLQLLYLGGAEGGGAGVPELLSLGEPGRGGPGRREGDPAQVGLPQQLLQGHYQLPAGSRKPGCFSGLAEIAREKQVSSLMYV